MPETNGITSHSHVGSHNVTQCIHTEEMMQKKEPDDGIKAGAENQSANQSTGNNSPEESASFPYTAVAQVKNMITKGIGFLKNLGAEKAAAPSTEIQSLGYGEAIGTTLQSAVEPKSIVESDSLLRVNSALEANKVGAKENFGLAGLKEQLQNVGKNRKLAETKKRAELQIQAEKAKGIAIEHNYLLDTYNKNGEYTRIKSAEEKARAKKRLKKLLEKKYIEKNTWRVKEWKNFFWTGDSKVSAKHRNSTHKVCCSGEATI